MKIIAARTIFKLFIALLMFNYGFADSLTTQSNFQELLDLRDKTNSMFKQGKFKEAIIISDHILKIDPYNIDALNKKGQSLEELEEYPAALLCYQRAMKLDPTNLSVLNNLGVLLNNIGKYNEAIKYFSKAIENDPQFATAFYNRGVSFQHLKEFTKAAQDYGEAVNLRPTYYAALRQKKLCEHPGAMMLNQKGLSIMKQGTPEEAVKLFFNKAIKIYPEYAGAWNNRGDAYMQLGKKWEALKNHKRAVELEPENSMYWFKLGWSYYNIDQDNNAIMAINKAIEQNDLDANFWNAKGKIYSNKIQFANALSCFNRAIELKPNFSTPLIYRGELFLNLGLLPKAEADIERALKIESNLAYQIKEGTSVHKRNLANVNYLNGKIALERKNYEEAVLAFNSVAEYVQDDYIARLWENYSRYLLINFHETSKTKKLEELVCILRDLDIISKNPNEEIRAYANYLAGYIYYQIGDSYSAFGKFEKSSKIKSEFKPAAVFMTNITYCKAMPITILKWWSDYPFTGGKIFFYMSMGLFLYYMMTWLLPKLPKIPIVCLGIIIVFLLFPIISSMKIRDIEFTLQSPPQVLLTLPQEPYRGGCSVQSLVEIMEENHTSYHI